MLPFEQRLGPAAVGLVHGNHGAAIRALCHLHLAEAQRLDQLARRAGIALIGCDDECPTGSVRAICRWPTR